jgi:hypothetical protein
VLRPTVALPGAPTPRGAEERAPQGNWRWGAAALLVAAAVAAVVLLRAIGPSTPAEARLRVRSQPMGASVLLDGHDTGVVTDGEIVVPAPVPDQVALTFRKSGHRDETRSVRLPLPAVDPGGEHLVSVSLDGHVEREARVEKGGAPGAIDLVLERQAAAGTVAVSSSYPLDVLWRGRPLARGETSPRVSLPGGRQVLTLVSRSLFLKADVVVEVPPGGEIPLEAPIAGRLNVRAVPDGCEVFVDGAFVDYPPILDWLVAAGPHTISFRWPDGTRKEQRVEVMGGASSFVSERKEQP